MTIKSKILALGLAGQGMVLSSCSTSKQSAFEITQAELEQSDRSAANIDSQKEKIESTIKLFRESFSSYEKETLLPALKMIYAEQAFLNDRIQLHKGIKEIETYFANTFDKIESARFDMLEVTYGSKDAYVRWDMHIKTEGSDKHWTFPGMSQLRFNEEGKIIFHFDHWDYAQLLEKFPGIGGVVRYIRSL
ncbi:MAG: nuclear transport factor 2 family protein [Oligoflexales bacterium]